MHTQESDLYGPTYKQIQSFLDQIGVINISRYPGESMFTNVEALNKDQITPDIISALSDIHNISEAEVERIVDSANIYSFEGDETQRKLGGNRSSTGIFLNQSHMDKDETPGLLANELSHEITAQLRNSPYRQQFQRLSSFVQEKQTASNNEGEKPRLEITGELQAQLDEIYYSSSENELKMNQMDEFLSDASSLQIDTDSELSRILNISLNSTALNHNGYAQSIDLMNITLNKCEYSRLITHP